MTVFDLELTLNRFGFSRPATNKIQIGFLRVGWHRVPGKYAISFEINWRVPAGASSSDREVLTGVVPPQATR